MLCNPRKTKFLQKLTLQLISVEIYWNWIHNKNKLLNTFHRSYNSTSFNIDFWKWYVLIMKYISVNQITSQNCYLCIYPWVGVQRGKGQGGFPHDRSKKDVLSFFDKNYIFFRPKVCFCLPWKFCPFLKKSLRLCGRPSSHLRNITRACLIFNTSGILTLYLTLF